jgi:hypothetical protein
MRKVAIAVMLALISSGSVFAQAQKLRDTPAARRQNLPPRRAALQGIVLGFYINQFRQLAEGNDELFVKVLPFLEEFIQERFEFTERRRIALNQLRLAVAGGSSDDDIRALIRELDEADGQILKTQQDFMRNVDPLLNTRQQARLRTLLDMTDQEVRRLVTGIQNPAQANREPNQKN